MSLECLSKQSRPRTPWIYQQGQQRVTVTLRRKDGRTLHACKAARAETHQKAIYDALGVDPAPRGVRKMIV